jgi:hypothetical protein
MRSALVLAVLALTLSACGATAKDSTKDFKGPDRAVAAAVEDLETAARDNDAGKACTKLFSTGLLATLKTKGTTCQDAVKNAFKDADTVDLTVDDVSIAGTKATAKVTSGTGSNKKTDRVELEQAGTAWRISSL